MLLGANRVLTGRSTAFSNGNSVGGFVDASSSVLLSLSVDCVSATAEPEDFSKELKRDVVLVTLGGGKRYEGLGVLWRAVGGGSDTMRCGFGVNSI